jgi:hypothetical protein
MTVLKLTAQASIRHGVSARATADIATSVLIDYGVIKKDDTEQVIDPKKIQRAKDKTMKASCKMMGSLPCYLMEELTRQE